MLSLHSQKGEMQEWLNWPAWKVGKPQKGFGGSNPPFSAKNFLNEVIEKNRLVFFCFCVGGGFVSRWRCGRVICALYYCSVGALLRNYKPCAYNQKVNIFPFSLFAQCLQLRCSPPLQYLPACSAQTCSDRSNPSQLIVGLSETLVF